MENLDQAIYFVINPGALGGALGAFLVMCGSHFAVLDIGVRKNKPLCKEPYAKQALYVLAGWLVAAAVRYDTESLFFIIYVSIGGGWLYILQGFIKTAQVFSQAMVKRNEAAIAAAGGGQ